MLPVDGTPDAIRTVHERSASPIKFGTRSPVVAVVGGIQFS